VFRIHFNHFAAISRYLSHLSLILQYFSIYRSPSIHFIVSYRFCFWNQLMQLFIFIFVLQVMNVFVNLFGHKGKFSVKDRKSNLRGCRLTDRSRHSSFHLDFTWNEGRKIGGCCQKSAASGGQPRPSSLGNSQGFLTIIFYSPRFRSRRNVQNFGSPNDEQMQFISK
jgi:hypothetical protein